MALPTQKRSKSRQKRKQYQYRLKKIYLSICPKCQKPKLSHQVCHFCGTYMEKEIIKSEAGKRKNKDKKRKEEKKKTERKDTKEKK
ncbi:50S ribosomal protein L32 [Candidatus Parcubacteria bacterium 4484_255]|nr:MAG: 50S ribosomal protein L32 [Candidatus Parcubacteria bacterium 4484_255]